MKQQMMPWLRTKVAALQLVKVVHTSVAMTLRQVRAMELVVVLVELAVVELAVVELVVVELAVVETRRNEKFKNKRNPSYFYSRLSVDG